MTQLRNGVVQMPTNHSDAFWPIYENGTGKLFRFEKALSPHIMAFMDVVFYESSQGSGIAINVRQRFPAARIVEATIQTHSKKGFPTTRIAEQRMLECVLEAYSDAQLNAADAAGTTKLITKASGDLETKVQKVIKKNKVKIDAKTWDSIGL